MNQAFAIIDQLIQQGVTKFCIAPGSRSAPLALAAASHPKADCTVHFDERGLGFFALGYAKAKGLPAAVITTSGTAVANLLPSVMEAYHSGTPMILLTADRPHELRDCGANQTTDQVKLFNNVIRYQTDLSPHLDLKTIRSVVAHTVFSSFQNLPGPVHLNCPFQEPFPLSSEIIPGKPIPFFLPNRSTFPMITHHKRGVILLGPIPTDPRPVIELSEKLGWPLFADLLSNARSYPANTQIRNFDYLIRQENDLNPDCILHFGGRLLSKHLLEFAKQADYLHVSPFPTLQDPARRITLRFQSDIEPFCKTFQGQTDPAWLPFWQEKDLRMTSKIEELFETSEFTEAHATRSMPSDFPIFIGNSMPIRDADHFFFSKQTPRIFANRGVSGIDGNIATAAGIADALKSPITIFLGDQSALHDLNSIPLIKKHHLRLIISNNFGGGIFDHLPVSKSPLCEKLFTASHPWHFEGIAQMFDIPYFRFTKALDEFPSYGIVEIVTNRKENLAFHKKLLENNTPSYLVQKL